MASDIVEQLVTRYCLKFGIVVYSEMKKCAENSFKLNVLGKITKVS